jgi:dUTP pyrophosphatase
MSRVAYIAQPIDQAYDRTLHAAEVNKIVATLTVDGYHCYLPALAWRVGAQTEPDPRFDFVNRACLENADLLVAYLPERVATIGVPMEIQTANDLGIPVVVVTSVASFALARPGIASVASAGDILAAVEKIGTPLPALGREIRMVIREGHDMPTRAYPDDAGIDLVSIDGAAIVPGGFVDLRSQVEKVQLPHNTWGLITGRSSTLRKHGLHVPIAVIDTGWRGPLFVGVWNLSSKTVIVDPGTRLAQLIAMPLHALRAVQVLEVDDHDRGENGFGSSGG